MNFNEKAFSEGPVLCPRKYNLKFYPSFTGFTSVVNSVYSRLRVDDGIYRWLPIEAIRYYGSCLFWLRVIRLKLLFHDKLTTAEKEIRYIFDNAELTAQLTIPEPLFWGLQAIGEFTTKAGLKMRPTFPELPAECTEGIPGSFGVIDEENHHWYEDYPVIGPAYEALVQRVRMKTNSGDYKSVFAPPDLSVNTNLQGFDQISLASNDEIRFLQSLGVRESGFENIKNTGIDYRTLRTISDFLEKSNVFRNFRFSDLTSAGTVAQQIKAQPVFEDYKLCRAADGRVEMQSYSDETPSMAEVSKVYGLNLWKENLPDPELWEQVRPWSSVTFTPLKQPSEKWVCERNKYRNMPECFQERNFASGSQVMTYYRYKVISNLIQRDRV